MKKHNYPRDVPATSEASGQEARAQKNVAKNAAPGGDGTEANPPDTTVLSPTHHDVQMNAEARAVTLRAARRVCAGAGAAVASSSERFDRAGGVGSATRPYYRSQIPLPKPGGGLVRQPPAVDTQSRV